MYSLAATSSVQALSVLAPVRRYLESSSRPVRSALRRRSPSRSSPWSVRPSVGSDSAAVLAIVGFITHPLAPLPSLSVSTNRMPQVCNFVNAPIPKFAGIQRVSPVTTRAKNFRKNLFDQRFLGPIQRQDRYGNLSALAIWFP